MPTAQQDQAYRIGRAARIRGLDLEAANVELARRFGWQDALIDECERGWWSQNELMQPYREADF